MRVSHIESHINQQRTLKEFISSAVDNLVKIGTANISQHRVEARLNALKEHWQKFVLNHEAINIGVNELSASERRYVLDRSYFKNNYLNITQECYLDALEQMNTLLDELPNQNRRSLSAHSISQSSTGPTVFHRGPRLPQITLQKFDGSPSEWLPFKDLFTSIVLDNPTLSAVEKLQYLKTNLVGSAAQLIKNTSLTADNFQKAWDSLVSFYENKRLLVHSALHSLVTLKRMTKESASEMEQLYSSVMQIYRTLETLQRPVDSWDDFLVFIAVHRLDSESVKTWEHHLGSSKEPPTWSQFTEFLMTRMLSLQAYEKSLGGKLTPHSTPRHAKSHFSGQENERNSESSSKSCIVCSSSHYISSCPKYNSQSIQDKLKIVTEKKLCYNCLGPHQLKACRSTKRCFKCGKKHHSSIHQENKSTHGPYKQPGKYQHNNSSNPSTSRNAESEPSAAVHHTSQPVISSPCIFLATAQVLIYSEHGEPITARALIDQGSEISLISERLTQLLHLPRQKSSIRLVGIGAQRTCKTKGTVSFKIKPHFDSTSTCGISAHVLSKLTTTIPTVRTTTTSWSHLAGLTLADPNYNNPGQIDIILGADIYGQIIEEGIIKGAANTPIAQLTTLGWIISGPSGLRSIPTDIQGYHVSIDTKLYDLLQKFWQLEEPPSTDNLLATREEQECENHFKSTHSRDSTGRYTVKLPLKKATVELGDSKRIAHRMLSTLSKKFESNPSYHQTYSKFLQEYAMMKHMRLVPTISPEPERVFYLPHHGVIKESSLTTKLRVVFNGSSRTSSGMSLNNLLHTGAKHQTDLFNVLIWFRRFRYVFSTDIEKMYRQINVHPDDWDLQRILWLDTSLNPITYQLTTVTYGLACAPFLALRTLLQLIEDEGHKYPLAVPVLEKGRYVDDIFGGADSISQAEELLQQVSQLCAAGGFPLSKWSSNEPTILQSTSPEKRVTSLSLPIEDSTTIQTLGLSWKPASDTFQFTVKKPNMKVISKRSTLSTIAQLFDPLGLLSPVTIKAKIFIQELWSIKLDWDDPLPPHIAKEWTDFIEQLEDISNLSFPRWLGINDDSTIQIHGFCDASQSAIATAVYVRSTNNTGEVKVNLICAKTKVAPLKRLTIPRLELSGAVLLAKLVSHVIKTLDFGDAPIYLWTDSAIAHTWINNHPSRWKEFIHNRVCLIQDLLPQAIWKFVPGKDNPADCATRGFTPNQLSQYSIWWKGTHWLTEDSSTWPSEPQLPKPRDNLEERPAKVATINRRENSLFWDLIHRYSNLTRLLRITAMCQRFIARLRKIPKSSIHGTPITTQELESAKNFWVKIIQKSYFSQEFKRLSNNQLLPKISSLIRLTPFIDKNGYLRVGGRLQSSLLDPSTKHPLILPKDSPLTKLIISDAHQQTLHGGTQVTLAYIRDQFWIIGGRAPVRSFILKCVRCTRYRQKRAQQIMGQLPTDNVIPSRPFLHAGIDYAGPLHLKTWKGRGARTYKAYIALFVCHATSAIHLELVTDYSSETFLAAYKRFTARRGICATLRSDCGTTLTGADSELQKLFSSASKESQQLASLLANDGTQWIFNPPAAPHFGGKWEAGVKSVKHHLRRVIGEQHLTYEEMTTLLTQIEAVLNSRPLSPLTNDPEDLTPLTPGHFLIGNAPTIIPEPSLEIIKTSRLSRWQHIRQMVESFWTRWSREYLQRYQSIYKWNQTSESIKEGAMVLVIDERYPPSKWPLGRVIQLHPGKDGHTRVITVRTQISTFKRPIVKVCPLPIEVDSL